MDARSTAHHVPATRRLRDQVPAFHITEVLLGLFHCVVDRRLKGKAGASVMKGLDLLPKEWPDGLRHFTYLDRRTLSIPLKSGVSLENRSPESLVCQLVLCHSKNSFDKPKVLFSDDVSLEPPYDLQRRFVAVFSGKSVCNAFQTCWL